MSASTNEDLKDELAALSSIYSADELPTTSSSAPPSILHQLLDGRYLLHLPATPPLTLHFHIPPTYPNEPPQILDPPESRGVQIAKDVLEETFTPGCVVFFDLIETLVERIPQSDEADARANPTITTASSTLLSSSSTHDNEITTNVPADDAFDSPSASTALRSVDQPPWHISPAVIEKKSTFLARCVPVSTAADAHRYLADVKADKKLSKCTHNISAYRICFGRGDAMRVVQDCDDDGETAAGGRLGKLLEMMGVGEEEDSEEIGGGSGSGGKAKVGGPLEKENGRGVLVVVSRWYGGIKLGPARFGVINNAARECLLQAGWGKEGKKKKKKR